MTSLSQILPFFIPVMLSSQPGHSVPTSSSVSLREGATLVQRQGITQLADSRTEIPLQRYGSVIPADSQAESSAPPLVVQTSAPDWLVEALSRIDQYAALSDNWKGPGSLAPSQQAREEAKELAEQLALEVPDVTRPSVGADDEGAITLHWATPSMSATLTAYGDGTYSYYAENSFASDRSDSDLIGAPLPELLVSIMAVEARMGPLAA
jgi:hypothetical protein